jgi:putative two-component system response regulator
LILLDLFMPHPDGFSVLESLRADRSEIYLPIIVLTADVNEETKRRALHCGATDFLNKPLYHIEVLLRIRNLLEARGHLSVIWIRLLGLSALSRPLEWRTMPGHG